MDQERVAKKVEWLDEEHRKDKRAITELKKRLSSLEKSLGEVDQRIQGVESELARIGALPSKIGDLDASLSGLRDDIKGELSAQEQRRKRREREARKRQDLEFGEVTKTLDGFRKEMEAYKDLRKQVQENREGREGLRRLIDQLEAWVGEVRDSEQERSQTIEFVESNYQQDIKRLNDLRAEFAALRKRFDELNGKMDLTVAGQKKTDARLNELLSTETERREAQQDFIERVKLQLAERDQQWKDWSQRFETIETQSQQLATHLKEIEATERAVKQAQDVFVELTEKFNRRLNEITEMQRLGEERFRQEWATFKADDQKRWTNYQLSQDEHQSEANRQRERFAERLTRLEDTLQEVQDLVQHLGTQSEKSMQTLLANLKEWVAENERFMGSIR